jgi:hypothetical protein
MIKILILGAGPYILLGQDRQKPFQLMFTLQMQRQPFDEAAISPDPGAVIALCRECKVVVSNNFLKSLHRFVPIHLAIVIYEQPVPQGGANGRQPIGLETNSTSAASASRRSP